MGPVIASAVMILLSFTIRQVFWLSLLPGIIALLFILFVVKEGRTKSVSEFHLLDGVKSVLKRDFSFLLIVVGVFSVGAFNFSFVLLNASEAGISDSFLPLVYAAINVATVVVAIPAGTLSDRIGKEKVMVIGYSVFLLSALLILLPLNGFFALLVAVVYGVYLGIVETVQRAMIPDYVKEGYRGTAYGLYYLVIGSTFFVSNSIVGVLWEFFGSFVASTYSTIFAIIGILALIVFIHSQQK
jgi:MFS family permease